MRRGKEKGRFGKGMDGVMDMDGILVMGLGMGSPMDIELGGWVFGGGGAGGRSGGKMGIERARARGRGPFLDDTPPSQENHGG